ncbi:MAG TPA: folylpolyglutamate synthase/dihydrofolate synthase family protein [Vicinamibacterales bacterium]|nr:folylpolyglutamate synthase/dihydrofolate synthase family protein [Vicinamibacterales bacterium]
MDPLAYLFGLEQFGIKFGLENITAIVERLGRPDRAYRIVHVAGTNGKGSVTAMTDAALRAAGHRSARYTSPHLVDLTERFVVDGAPVTPAALVHAAADVRDAIESLRADGTLLVQPTFFEATTAIALELFRRGRVEVAVLEVGLGGRLDATNVVSPVATAITSIAFDHQQYLGSTLAQIAYEKAGIIKPHVPVVVGELEPEARDAIERVARERSAPVIAARRADADGFAIGLRGAHQVINAAVAVRLLDVVDRAGVSVTRDAVAEGLRHPQWPGRLDERRLSDGRELLLDAAHNPAGAAALASYLRDDPVKRPLVFAAMNDKDVDGMLRELLCHGGGAVASVVVTRATNARSADPETLAARVRAIAPALEVTTASAVADALAAAWRRSPRIVVAGSIFLLGDVARQLGLHL